MKVLPNASKSQELINCKSTIDSQDKIKLGPDARPLIQALRQDPRPHYQDDPDRVYGMRFSAFEIRFTVKGNVLTVSDVIRVD